MTSRLTLEPLSFAHSHGMFQLWSDADVCKYVGPVKDYAGAPIHMPVTTSANSDRIIDFWIKAAKDGWGFRWAVLTCEPDCAFTGIVGFNTLKPCAEIAYHQLPALSGKGFMTEACHAAIGWVHEQGASEVDAFIEPDNAASVALATRLGLSATDTYSDGARRYRMSVYKVARASLFH
ncbi:MAG: GNAT family N-acetyltransferase [Rhodospirillaceae bacterium]